ncbi:MAG: cobalt-precorrin-5B (C(1))-methyltransferase CbiD [Deltaproteobacteria bacterium]|nr:cobalt-precorrin-5B (C(1))-methyltransferase CbiD [Deltaproteobacteria bacterium]
MVDPAKKLANPSPKPTNPGPKAGQPKRTDPAKALPLLKTGFSTGTAATAAALAAAIALKDGRIPDQVTVTLPKGGQIEIPIFEGTIQKCVQTVVVKEAGDDPDVTNRAHVGVILAERGQGLAIAGGEGVGRITKPGLVLPPGEWAINPVPRRMLAENLGPFLKETGLAVTVFIRDGQALAEKTLNPRLGVVGGLSVLGTSGLVKPFSHGAYVATIDGALSVARAIGLTEAVLTTGGRSEAFARELRPDLPEEAFVQIADYFQAGLAKAAQKGFTAIGLAVFFGKAVKQAAGHGCTHAHKNDMDLKALAQWLHFLPNRLRDEIARSPTALAALDLLKAHGQARSIEIVAQKALSSARAYAGPKPRLWAVILDFDGTVLAQAE